MLLLLQIVIVGVVAVVAFVLMRGGSNARHLAVRRIFLALFVVAAVVSVFQPTVLSKLARLVGVGRGTDLLLYGLVIAFLAVMTTTHQRFLRMERAMTAMARRQAIEDAPSPTAFVNGGGITGHLPDGVADREQPHDKRDG